MNTLVVLLNLLPTYCKTYTMKKILLVTISCFVLANLGKAQLTYTFVFPFDQSNLLFEPNDSSNCWQIGSTTKPFIGSNGLEWGLVTDTINSYPSNTNSYFTVPILIGETLAQVNLLRLDFDFKADTDTLLDYGTIEFSADSGATWFDATGFNTVELYPSLPVLTGVAAGAPHIVFDLGPMGPFVYNGLFLARFGFHSDSLDTARSGLLFNYIVVSSIIDDVPEYASNEFSVKVDRTSSSGLWMSVEDDKISNYNVDIIDMNGRSVQSSKCVFSKSKELSIEHLSKGIYGLLLTDPKTNRTAFTRFYWGY
jgi:Secretion system C-terminal sorting domain